MIANRKFAALAPCANGQRFVCWPAAEQQMASKGILGVIPRWRAIGDRVSLDAPYWRQQSPLVAGDLGHSIHCLPSLDSTDFNCGVAQGSVGDFDAGGPSSGSALILASATAYSLRLVLRAGAVPPPSITVSLTDADQVLWNCSITFATHDTEWRTFARNLTVARASSNATLMVSSSGGGGEWWLGSVSLQPRDNTWRGLRRDVIARLKQTRFRGLLRYPGGCFAPFYRWRVGLLQPDLRPPIATPPGYCTAVAGGVQAYTDGAMELGIGIDDYLALCEEVGLLPAITVRLQTASEGEVRCGMSEW